jgi:excisionase family DNA binding protein
MFDAELGCNWLTALEAAQYLKVERRTLLDWARQGKVKGFQLSGVTRHVWRFRRSDLDAMLVPSSAYSAEGGSK